MRNAALMASTALIPVGAIFAMADASDDAIKALEDKLKEQADGAEAIVALATSENRDLTDDEQAKVDEFLAECDRLKKQIDSRRRIAAARTGAGRSSAPEPSGPPAAGAQPGQRGVPAQPRVSGGRSGFGTFGEFAVAVRRGSVAGGTVDQRLQAAATTYGNESVGADGGFAVPPDFRREIWQKVMGEENLLTRCDNLVTGSNTLTIPKDETTPWQTSGGILAYWESEAQAVTQSKPQLGLETIRLQKLMALVPISDELLEDAPGLESYLRAKAPQKMVSKLNTAIIRGTGAGQPLGILNSGCLISVAKETSQPADTVYFANVNKMWSRMYAPCRRNAVWLINQDIEPQLDGMAFDPDAASKVPIYIGPGGAADSPYARLKGRPVVPVEACSTLGDQGDIMLVDLTQYMTLTKGMDIKTDVSMHLFFDQGLQAFRFTFRVNGQPWWGGSITPQFGNATRSCFVTLDERA